MGLIASAATTKALQQLMGATGLNTGLAALSEGSGLAVEALEAAQIRAHNAAPDIAERDLALRYPAVNVYCEKLVNRLTEKFRSFSGRAEMAIEIRCSQDRLEGLQEALQVYVDAAALALSASRGDWGDGMFYGGGYEVSFGPLKRGGKNFIQAAKVTFEIGVSKS